LSTAEASHHRFRYKISTIKPHKSSEAIGDQARYRSDSAGNVGSTASAKRPNSPRNGQLEYNVMGLGQPAIGRKSSTRPWTFSEGRPILMRIDLTHHGRDDLGTGSYDARGVTTRRGSASDEKKQRSEA
jgi:hypothetical protein